MPKCFAIMLNYAQIRWESYCAQIYAGIMCQGLTVTPACYVSLIYNIIHFLLFFGSLISALGGNLAYAHANEYCYESFDVLQGNGMVRQLVNPCLWMLFQVLLVLHVLFYVMQCLLVDEL